MEGYKRRKHIPALSFLYPTYSLLPARSSTAHQNKSVILSFSFCWPPISYQLLLLGYKETNPLLFHCINSSQNTNLILNMSFDEKEERKREIEMKFGEHIPAQLPRPHSIHSLLSFPLHFNASPSPFLSLTSLSPCCSL